MTKKEAYKLARYGSEDIYKNNIYFEAFCRFIDYLDDHDYEIRRKDD